MAKKNRSSAARTTKAKARATTATASVGAAGLPIVEVYRARKQMRANIAKDRADKFKAFLQSTRNPKEAPGAGKALRAMMAVPGKENLRILAEGDSWFEYPLPIPEGDGVIHQLQKLLGYSIANMAHHGLEAEQMLGLDLRQEIISRLTDPSVKFDALLFSGGGNDIAGDQFCIWLKDSPPVAPPPQMINANALSAALAMLEAEFRELVDLRDQCSPQTVIFVNEYDFPPITGKGVCGTGPWLKPSLDFVYKRLGVANPDPNDEFLVVKTIMQQFNAMLNRVAADPAVKGFVVVPTQGTLQPNASDWQNEIHPSTAGFVKIAQRFQTALQTVFP